MTTYKAHEFGERHVEGWCDRGGYKKQEAEEERKDKEEVLASPFVLLSYK